MELKSIKGDKYARLDLQQNPNVCGKKALVISSMGCQDQSKKAVLEEKKHSVGSPDFISLSCIIQENLVP